MQSNKSGEADTNVTLASLASRNSKHRVRKECAAKCVWESKVLAEQVADTSEGVAMYERLCKLSRAKETLDNNLLHTPNAAPSQAEFGL